MFPLRDSVTRTRLPVVVGGLIALNIAVFFYQLGLGGQELERFITQHALIPLRYFSPAWAARNGLSSTDITPFLTNTFMHGGWLHIIANLWTLYIFGPALEDRLGPARFLALYLAAGILASIAHAVFNASSGIPALGASGAIAGVIGAYAVRFPVRLGARADSDRDLSLHLQHSGHGVRGHLVPHAGDAGHDRAVPAQRRRRHRLVGPHRRLPRRHLPGAAVAAFLGFGRGRRPLGQSRLRTPVRAASLLLVPEFRRPLVAALSGTLVVLGSKRTLWLFTLLHADNGAHTNVSTPETPGHIVSVGSKPWFKELSVVSSGRGRQRV